MSISVIATVLNEARSIDSLVESLASQSLEAAEIVIVDGGSSDGTWEKLQALSARLPRLKAIRDESCNLAHSTGPIARGRNVAIANTHSEIVACADAGCSYAPDWLQNLTKPIVDGVASYSLGGSCLDPQHSTDWDYAVAPFFGVSTASSGQRKSCTARSMAFLRSVWDSAGRFPESTFLGEDTLFDERVRPIAPPAWPFNAMAFYSPGFDYRLASRTMARYSAADGALTLRRTRAAKMLLRCLAQAASLAALPWTYIPLAAVILLEFFFAFERDRSVLTAKHLGGLLPRILFSFSIPWIATWSYLAGAIHQDKRLNAR